MKNKTEINRSLLRLFNGVIATNDTVKCGHESHFMHNLNITAKFGYIVDNKVDLSDELFEALNFEFNINHSNINSTLHDNWKSIQDTPDEILLFKQILHYFNTNLLISDNLEFGETICKSTHYQGDYSFKLIRGLYDNEVVDNILKLTKSGIALGETTLKDIMTLVKNYDFDKKLFKTIKNKELKSLLNDYYNVVPTQPTEYLRYVISKLTNESLLIKNTDLIEKIKESNGKLLDMLLLDAPDNLAEIFYRFKPLFLAMKTISENKTFFNRLRKKAKKIHKPMPIDYLNNVTNFIKNNALYFNTFVTEVKKVNIFRKIRLAYSLKMRMSDVENYVYQIRNGKSWVKTKALKEVDTTDSITLGALLDNEFGKSWVKTKALKEVDTTDNIPLSSLLDDEFKKAEINDNNQKYIMEKCYEFLIENITKDISKQVKGKNILIPEYMHYALPATEKQFIGNFPNNSYIDVEHDMIVGIQWFNTTQRIDLDLSAIDSFGKYGWDSDKHNSDYSLMFSGDKTDAPYTINEDGQKVGGATEFFYLKKHGEITKLLDVNYYNHDVKHPVECKIILAQEKAENFGTDYMVDVNNIITTQDIIIKNKQNIIGVIEDNKMVFTNTSLGDSITSENDELNDITRLFFREKILNPINFNEILINAGATIITKIARDFEEDLIDLRPNALNKTSILNLMVNVD